MDYHEDDDTVDKIMVFLSRWSKPITEEWFKLAQWLLIMSAFSFLSDQTGNNIYRLMLGASVGFIWLYFMFGYMRLWHSKAYEISKIKKSKSPTSSLKGFLIWGAGVLVILFIASIFLELAILFGSEASQILHGSTHK